MPAVSEHRRMFKVTFQDERNNDLAPPVRLPAIPSVGEPVYLREMTHHKARIGRVASRHWYIATKEPENSEVVVVLSME